jgi:hypothetical protein
MPLEATGADDRWKWCSYELGRWDGNLGRSEQMPVNLDSNFRGEVKEARRLELRSSGHAEAMDNDFGARGRLEGYDSGGLAHPNIQLLGSEVVLAQIFLRFKYCVARRNRGTQSQSTGNVK